MNKFFNYNCRNIFQRIPNKYKILSLVLSFYVTIIFLYGKVRYLPANNNIENFQILRQPQNHDRIVKTFYDQRRHWMTSNLGDILYKNANISKYTRSQGNKKYTILIWKYWDFLSARHVRGFNGLRESPFDECSVDNCELVGNDSALGTADAVVVHLQTGVLPDQTSRTPQQRWIFLSDEAPPNTFTLSKNQYIKWTSFKDIFNWSMTYKSDSDIPVPYGRTISLRYPSILNVEDLPKIIPHWSEKNTDVAAAILMSNCNSGPRRKLIKQLRPLLLFDGFGRCFENKTSCPGSFRKDCPILSKYYFYFSFENSFCNEYLTEKIFYNAYEKGAIPVILGPSIKNCKTLLPPKSYIHVGDFLNVKDLASHINSLMRNTNKMLEYHLWRINFEVRNEHGYFASKSQHYCRICEALNYNSEAQKIYGIDELSKFFSSKLLCKSPVTRDL